jgi:hypothetical protein
MFNIINANNDEGGEFTEKLLATTTSELFMPVRLYYKIYNKASLVKSIKKLRCAEFAENTKNYFIISYYKEAKKINLEVAYQDVPQDLYPVNLANCYITGSTLCIDVKSLRRGVEIINFFSEHIHPFNSIEITAFAHSNKAISCKNQEELKAQFDIDYGELFDNLTDNADDELTKSEKGLKTQLSINKSDAKGSQDNSIDTILSSLNDQEKENYPSAEKIRIQYKKSNHQELINMLTFRSVIKEKVAIMRYNGYKNYTPLDAIQELMDFENIEA